MYSNDSKKGFSILDLLVKIIFAFVFIFILIWLFNKKIPNVNMKPFYSNVFRENIKYMQDAGESYFTDDKMPSEVGDSVKLSLGEMESMNLVIPFVDEDGNSCNKNDSFVSVTKLGDDEGYELKTYLVCPKETNYIVKKLGCHTYCKGNECGNTQKVCSAEDITEYQYKKLVSSNSTKYNCDKYPGYTLSGKNCVRKELKDSKSAAVTTTSSHVDEKPATLVPGNSTLIQLTTQSSTTTTQLTTQSNTTTTQLTTQSNTTTTQLTTQSSTTTTQLTTQSSTTTTPLTVQTSTESYTCTKTRTVTKCSTTYVQEAYSCNCKTTCSGGHCTTTCNTCYRSVPVQTCHDVQQTYTDTCYRTVYSCPSNSNYHTGSGSSLKCYKKTTTYSCPSESNYQTGSGSSLKCYKKTTTYSCPSESNYQTGSGSSLKCYKKTTTYSCPSESNYQTGSGSSLKCYKKTTTYYCPSETDVQEGSGSSLKCYKVKSGNPTYNCKNYPGYTLVGNKCRKTITQTTTDYNCDKYPGYTLVGKKCNLYKTDKQKATAKTTSSSKYVYKWSTSSSLSGYTKTGKTRTVKGKEICN